MAFGPITSWQTDGETVEIVTEFILGGSKITVDGDCKQTLTPWKKIMTTLTAYSKAETLFANEGPSRESYGFSSSHV